MPTVTRTNAATAGSGGAPQIPARFNVSDLVKVWNGGGPISIGASGLGVKKVQAALEEAGFSVGGADGQFGANTEKGLKAFQKTSALPASGKIDQATLAKLAGAAKPAGGTETTGDGKLVNKRFAGDPQLAHVLAGKALCIGAKGEGVKNVQGTLKDMGFSIYGKPDGEYGPQTQNAVRNFQVNASKMFRDVKVTGSLDGATMRALDKLAPKPGAKGQSLNVPAGKYDGKSVRVVVLKDEHRTFLFDKSGKLQAILGNAVGAKATSTDTGLKVVSGKLNEAESVALGKKMWGGPVFGPRIIDLSWADGRSSGEELHGTSAPQELGRDVSHGCMRHDNADVLKLYDALSVGDRVAVVEGLGDRHVARAASAGWVR
jgi:peptidoglycan hydrolase-like protein with peptidoglycan-binding domain